MENAPWFFWSLNIASCMVKGQVDDIEESAILEGYRCKDRRCNGFLLHDSGTSSVTEKVSIFLMSLGLL